MNSLLLRCGFVAVSITGSLAWAQGAGEPPSYGGRYPHLAVSNDQGECGIGAVVPWAGKLWFITYAPHKPLGSDDGLYEVDTNLKIVRRPESVGGTPAARLIHRETNTLAIGPYLIDALRNVTAIPPAAMEGRLTAHARHLSDPARKIFVYDMEGLLYELDLLTRKASRLFTRAAPGWHGKGAYSGQGVLVVANNGEHEAGSANKFKPFDYAIPNTRNGLEQAGVLAEWDGTTWKLIRRRQFTDVTGPGGIHGPPSPDAPLWAIGWDEKSVLLMVRSSADAKAGREPWHTFRLPIACASYTGDHGWHTEWPRIREIAPAQFGEPARYILTMHGGWYELPGTFSAEEPYGLRPICSHLKITGDVTPWKLDGEDVIVFGCDDTAKSGFKTALQNTRNDLNGRSNSNLWFTTQTGLRKLGRPGGTAYVWRGETVKAGTPSDPLLFAGGPDVIEPGGPRGYDRRVVHLAHGGKEPVTFTLQAADGKAWEKVSQVTVPAKSHAFHVLPENVRRSWIRVVADRDASDVTAVFRYGTRGGQVTDVGLFNALPDATSKEPWTAAVLRGAEEAELPLDVLATHVSDGKGNGTQAWRISMNDDHGFAAKRLEEDDPAATFLRKKAVPESPTVEFDAASVILREGDRVFRLPKPLDPAVAAAYEKPFASGWPRGLREVVTERALLNAAGTFYVVPRTTSGGAAKMQPVCSHGKMISDFCSWRGLLVLGGVRDGATGDPRVIGGRGSADAGAPVWVGDIDELWKFPKPTGRGGPWHKTAVKAGEPSDPYLLAGYQPTSFEVSNDGEEGGETVTFRVEIDPTGDGKWFLHDTIELEGGCAVIGLGVAAAHWVRLVADRDCIATATFTCE
jgi:hypothetical protein